MSALISKLQNVGVIKSDVLEQSILLNDLDFIKTSLPVLNVAFSGELDKGYSSGVTILAGQSKSFKTLLSLFCMKAYLDKYPDGIAILYDSEFGVTNQYLINQGIDTSRVLYVPIEHIEQLKFDMVKKLNEIKRGDKVFFLVDSLGSLPSKKEFEDAENEKSVADMTRAKSIRSFLRIITLQLTLKQLPCFIINHIYQTQELFSKTIISGGSSVVYLANQIFIISRSQEKEGDTISGYKFTINIEKSRYVKEKSKIPFYVSSASGINKYSGLVDLAIECGLIAKVSQGWYSKVINGEIEKEKKRLKDIDTPEYCEELLNNIVFQKWIEQKFKLINSISDADIIESDN